MRKSKTGSWSTKQLLPSSRGATSAHRMKQEFHWWPLTVINGIITPATELCFFSLLNCNTQIGTPTRGLRKRLLPCETAYARVTFQEVPTRLPPRKLLPPRHFTWRDVVTILVQKRNTKSWKISILWVTCERKAEASSRVEHFVMMWSAVMMNSWKHLMGYRPQFDLGPTRFLREGLRGTYAKVRTENGFPAKHMNHTIQFACKISVTLQEKQEPEVTKKKDIEHLNKRLRETACAASPTLSYTICLHRTYAPSGIAYALMMWVPPQSKSHHLKKTKRSRN